MSTLKTNYNKHYKDLFMSDDPIPRFDVIKNSDFEPAIRQGIYEENDEIRSITNCISRPTFANTIEKLDSAGELLERVTDVFYNLLNAASDEEKEQLAEKFTPILAAHQNNIMLNQDLFLRVKYVYTHPLKSLSPEKLRLTEKIYRSFRRSGAMLKGEDRKQFRKLTEEASKLTLQFQTNLLHARKKFSLNIIGKDMLDGVPETVLDTAAATARENGENGWTITLDEPVYMPVLTYCNNRELRRALYMAYHGVCLRKGEDCNTEICKDIVNVRQKMAQLLGYKSFADYVLEERMAGSKNNVYRMFSDLLEHYSDPARKEVSQVERYAKSMEGEVMYNTYANITYSQNVGVEVIAKNRLFENYLDLTSSVSAYYYQLGGNEQYDIDMTQSFSWNARVNANVKILRNLSAQATIFYESPRIVAQGSEDDSFGVDLAIKSSFLNDALSLSFSVRDLFNTRRRGGISTCYGSDFYQETVNTSSGRTWSLNLSYNFGNIRKNKKQ